jgi:hypothetical protein
MPRKKKTYGLRQVPQVREPLGEEGQRRRLGLRQVWIPIRRRGLHPLHEGRAGLSQDPFLERASIPFLFYFPIPNG